ncbi:kinase-like domain-containing protein [Protomyces lactucae-debilis]|uniref:Kinase-like domain-containing protein n=1 Tax=Protomyces lactucae-debilis TaxID=2754530 RepID=A0A1Y2EXQ9_PROLT|nr:kinase-like domain-containing protein [Protomyces lactucae-debilis]ORY76383.1 kinase-like domain-containing protein [Protomyces lactucae-debilis]
MPATELAPPPPKIPLHLQQDPADDEMRKTVVRRRGANYLQKEEQALLELQQRASARSPVSLDRIAELDDAPLNVYERGEAVDYDGKIYCCGAKGLVKQGGRLSAPNEVNFGYDDDRGDYLIHHGDHFAYRYEIVDILGKGSFGQVMRCIDYKTGSLVAIKTIRNKKRFHAQALVEVNILQRLREWDPEDKHCMIRYTDHFYFRHHLCIATNLLGMNLYEYIKANEFRGCSIGVIRSFTRQILSCLELLGRHRVIHCDLKPENILLVNIWESKIKIIDFGSSCFEDQKVYTYIQSRFYRSPEVILGMSYGLPIDIWSMACILAELYTGYPIFPGEDEQEQLSCIMELFGPPEKHLIENSTRKKLFFDGFGKPRQVVSSRGRKRRPSSKTLSQALKCQDEAFIDFLTRCLRWNPESRLTPTTALAHPFVTGEAMPVSLLPPPTLASRLGSPRKFEHRRLASGLPVKSH